MSSHKVEKRLGETVGEGAVQEMANNAILMKASVSEALDGVKVLRIPLCMRA